ncbi:MAG: hypothetical protein ACP5GA_02795, partial [Acidithiobacillus sp.]
SASREAAPVQAQSQGSEEEDADTADAGDAQKDADVPDADPLAQPGTTLSPTFVEVREDRVLLYARAEEKAKEYVYRIRPTSVGSFTTAPIYAESLYDRRKRAYAPAEGVLKVTEAPAPKRSKTAAQAKP